MQDVSEELRDAAVASIVKDEDEEVCRAYFSFLSHLVLVNPPNVPPRAFARARHAGHAAITTLCCLVL